MNNLQQLASLTAAERLSMQMKGLNPLNPADIKKFKSGIGISFEEKANRAKQLFEGATDLGGGNERDIDASSMINREINASELESQLTPKRNTMQDYRNQLNEEMSGYGSQSGKVFSTDDLMSIKRVPNNESVAQIKGNTETVKLEGFNLSKAYLNSFVVNLGAPSYQNRLLLYKNLQACLKGEEKYKNSQPHLQAYRQGVLQAEEAMYKKLQS
ncbi:MAG: hypothetical protein ABIP51_20620 [Bacteroidia bacterium]